MKDLYLRSKKLFSLIELMTVVLVILLLLSLLVPTFLNLKKNARAVICKNQMRQIGIMTTSYASENGGYLPNDNLTDIGINASSNNRLYEGWNGHFLPYIDSGINSYNKRSKLRINDGKVCIGGVVINSSEAAKTLLGKGNDGGWNIVNDAFQKGGFNDLKVFICPEIHSNTYDIGASNQFNGLKIPRINQIFDNVGSNSYDDTTGLPTTYFANAIFFGYDDHDNYSLSPIVKSLRLDEISNSSKKAFVVEGGGNYNNVGRNSNQVAYYTNGDLMAPSGIKKNNTANHRMNFVHDNYEQFWVMNSEAYVYYFPAGNVSGFELATKFNKIFAGKAIMFYSLQNSWGWNCYSIISYIDPSMNGNNGDTFKEFFKANPPGVALGNFVDMFEPEFHYLTGSMNVLFGDGAVSVKDQAWLNMNKDLIATITKE